MKNIVLVGFMGTGKSIIGQKLSAKLGLPFFDTDKIIEEEANMTIGEIFSRDGEETFRAMERETIARLSQMEGCVIATGGGAVLAKENMEHLKQKGVIVCLKADPKVILQRVGNTDTRPLLQSPQTLETIERILQAREKLYRGDLIIDTSFLKIEEVVNRIVSYLHPANKTKVVPVPVKENPYEIVIGSCLLPHLHQLISQVYPEGKVMVVSNPTVYSLWGETLEKGLEKGLYDFSWGLIPDGEEYKNMDSAMQLFDKAISLRLDRKSLIIAFGGGVIGDLAGFVASTFLRGIPFIQIPTTLLSQVDSSVGGKVAINHPAGKNLIGAFYQPKMVVADTSVLTTLPQRELASGLGEVIKYGMIKDAAFFTYLENNVNGILSLHQEVLGEIIETSCKIKSEIVKADEREENLRAILNYGHTIGHGIETATGYKQFRHGEAVSIGMEGAARIAVKRGILKPEVRLRQKSLLDRCNLPTAFPKIDPTAVLEAISKDKKMAAGKLRYILPTAVGEATICEDISLKEIHTALIAFAQESIKEK
jgi:3-dehydroquinate synthase